MTNFTKSARFAVALLGFVGLTGCVSPPVSSQIDSADTTIVNDAPDVAGETILLVSRADGSIVRQTVSLGADICIKAADSSTTSCLTQSTPIVNNHGVLVGYEMLAETIELKALN